MSEANAQLKPWVFFLCTALLLVASVVVIARHLRPSNADPVVARLRAVEAWRVDSGATWDRTQQGLQDLATRSKQAAQELDRDMAALREQIARTRGELEKQATGQLSVLETRIAANKKKGSAQAEALVQLATAASRLERGLEKLEKRAGGSQTVSGKLTEHVERLSAGLDALLPAGTILPWDPVELDDDGQEIGRRDVPEGWAICDGRGNTPDLEGRLLRGVTSVDEAGDTGGRSAPTKKRGVRILWPAGGAAPKGTQFLPLPTSRFRARSGGYYVRESIPGSAFSRQPAPYYTLLYIMKQ